MNIHSQFRLVLATLALGAVYGVAQDSGSTIDHPLAPPTSRAPVAQRQPTRVGPELFPSEVQSFDPAFGLKETSPASNPFVSAASETSQSISIQYTIRRPESVQVRTPDGKTTKITRHIFQTKTATVDVSGDLKTLELPPEGKRVAVLAVTAARHKNLLQSLRAAETPEEKAAASEALRENYTEHYAIETWWREQSLAELEARLKELRGQVTQRQESEEKYVSAAMTIAELWAEGIGITPPTPNRLPVGTPAAAVLPVPVTYRVDESAAPPILESPHGGVLQGFYTDTLLPRTQ